MVAHNPLARADRPRMLVCKVVNAAKLVTFQLMNSSCKSPSFCSTIQPQKEIGVNAIHSELLYSYNRILPLLAYSSRTTITDDLNHHFTTNLSHCYSLY